MLSLSCGRRVVANGITQATKVVVTVSVVAGDECLLVNYRSSIDNQAGWLLPTETVPVGGDPNTVAADVLRKDLGLNNVQLRMSHVEAFTGHDGTWHVPLHYWGDIPSKAPAAAMVKARTRYAILLASQGSSCIMNHMN